MTQQNIAICIDAYPDSETAVFRIGAADDILRLLADAHETEFSIPELVDATDVTRSTVWRAVDLLDDIGAVEIRETPQRNYISINADRLQKDDPLLTVPQAEFRPPIRAFVDRVQATITEAAALDELVGIIIFGSVARGAADRQSDIDCFVVVAGDRTTARRRITDLAASLATERFDGDRFEFEPYVESIESVQRADSKLRDIFTDGITVYGSSQLDSLRKAVLTNE